MRFTLCLLFIILFSYQIRSEELTCFYNQIRLDDLITDKQFSESFESSAIYYNLKNGDYIFSASIDFDQNNKVTLNSINLIDNSYYEISNIIALGTVSNFVEKAILFFMIDYRNKKFDKKEKFNIEEAIDYFLSDNYKFEDHLKILSSNSKFDVTIEDQSIDKLKLGFNNAKNMPKDKIINFMRKSSKYTKYPYSIFVENYEDQKALEYLEKLINQNLQKYRFSVNQTKYDYEKIEFTTQLPSINIQYKFSIHHPDYLEAVLIDPNKLNKSSKLPSITFWFKKSSRSEIIENIDKVWVSWIYITNYGYGNENYNLVQKFLIGGYCANLEKE